MTSPPAPDGFVVITVRDVYELLVDVQKSVLGLLEHDKTQTARQDDHEQRLKTLEGNRWPLQSLAVIVAIGALVLSFVPMLVR